MVMAVGNMVVHANVRFEASLHQILMNEPAFPRYGFLLSSPRPFEPRARFLLAEKAVPCFFPDPALDRIGGFVLVRHAEALPQMIVLRDALPLHHEGEEGEEG